MFDIAKIIGGLGDISKLFVPSIENGIQQKFENELKERLSKFQEIISMDDSPNRAVAIGNFTSELCTLAGSPVGFVSGQSIEVPVEYFEALVTIAAGKVRDDELLARLSFKPI